MAPKKIVVGITGSIAAYKSCDIISALRKAGHEIKVMMSPDARRFITPLTAQTLSGNKVITEMFDLPETWDIRHTSLGSWADLIVIAPATADMISKLAWGRADDIVSATVLSTAVPVVIAPAMNDNMYKHKAVRENISRLKKFGYKFVGPEKGRLACGYKGIGHISDVEDIMRAARKALT